MKPHPWAWQVCYAELVRVGAVAPVWMSSVVGVMKIGKTIQLAFTIGCFVALSVGGSAWSATPAAAPAVGEASIVKDLALLENRFFSRQYANDPTDKRIERLELLVFGGAQDGDLVGRWSRLNKAIVSRPAQAAESAAKPAPTATKEKAGAPEQSAKYPALNTLEWRALKKTYADESLDARLGRLEKKLFGQEAPGMAYVDRVDRLKKTLGVGITAAAPTGPVGPPPRARGRSGSVDSFMAPFGVGSGIQIYGDEGTDETDHAFGGGMKMNPFTFGFGSPAINGAFNQLFADMQRQMSDMERLGPGSWTLDPKTGEWVEQNSGKRVKPNGMHVPGATMIPRSGAISPKKPTSPLPRRQLPFEFGGNSKGDSALPPYADPNSI